MNYHPQQKCRIRRRLEEQGVRVFLGKDNQLFTFESCFYRGEQENEPIEFTDGTQTKNE